jgi:bifunctional DNA-binding transcriptional regulator/antitoxin component of YhaV-PrlF toxin-antitoxin module
MTTTPERTEDDSPVAVVQIRNLGRTIGFTLPVSVNAVLGWQLGDKVLIRATESENLVARRIMQKK